jgi:hypothetical protein
MTIEGVVGDSGLATSEDAKSHKENGTIFHNYMTPPVKEFHSKRKGTWLGSPLPSTPSTNLVKFTPNPIVISIVSHSYNTIGSNYNSIKTRESYSTPIQLGSSGFILIGSPNYPMGTQHVVSLIRYP